MDLVVLRALVVCGALLCLIGLASAQVTERFWVGRPAIALAYAVLGACVVMWIQFLVTWLAPPVGPYAAHVAVGCCLLYCIAKRSWRLASHAAPLVLAASGIALVYIGLLYLWRSDLVDYALAGTRFTINRGSMPADNLIPGLLATRISAGASTDALIGDWTGADRPPLQSGWILLSDALLSRLGFDGDILPFASGIVAQLLWIPAVYSVLRASGVSGPASLIAILFTGATGTLLTNTTYTWPKLLSAALVCCAIAILIDAARQPRGRLLKSLSAAAALFTLGALAHPAAAFAIPALVVLGVVALRGHPGWPRLLASLAAVATAIAVYLPWIAFQRATGLPGDRLLKWHLAGVVQIDGRSLWEALIDSYSQTSLADYVAARWQNLVLIVNPDLAVGLGSLSEAGIGERRAHEFFETSIALSLGVPLLILMAAAIVLHRLRLGSPPAVWQHSGWLVVVMLPCLLLWCLVLFAGGSTGVHQGSHVWILVLLAAPAAWLASVRLSLAATAWLTNLALMIVIYLPFFGATSVDPSALAIFCSGLALQGGVTWWALRRPSAPISPRCGRG